MVSPSRQGLEPSFVLHRHDWSESSLIVEVFSREHGRLPAVAKGAKRATSQLRPVLMPFHPIVLSFGRSRPLDDGVWLIRAADWAGGPAWPGGAAWLPGFYLNELLMRVLPRHDPQALLFDAYAQALEALTQPGLLEVALRAFELLLLRLSGHLPDLGHISDSGQALRADDLYGICVQQGMSHASQLSSPANGGVLSGVLSGAHWLSIEAVLGLAQRQPALEPLRDGGPGQADPADEPDPAQRLAPQAEPGAKVLGALMRACLPVASELKTITRALLDTPLSGIPLRTRQLMRDLQRT